MTLIRSAVILTGRLTLPGNFGLFNRLDPDDFILPLSPMLPGLQEKK